MSKIRHHYEHFIRPGTVFVRHPSKGLEYNTGDSTHERTDFALDPPSRRRRLLAHGADRPLHRQDSPAMTGVVTDV
jgi:hypothetical protein